MKPLPPAPWTGEPSPWLLRHLDSPVDWRPWHPERLREARERDCPVLLVLASADCPPFEQMARESFADPATAAVMNSGHVCVLADARWHRALDGQLQVAHQLLAGRAGGWPLVALIDPLDARPYFVGTHLPATASGVLPGFRDFLQQALHHHRRARRDLLAQGERLAAAFTRLIPAAPALEPWTPGPTPLTRVRQQLAAGFDAAHGHFVVEQTAVATPLAACRLLRAWRHTAESAEPDLHALYLATQALKAADTTANTPVDSLPSWLLAQAAAMALTGDGDFGHAAEAAAASLVADVLPAACGHPPTLRLRGWQSLAMAARWLDRGDWLNQAGRDFGTWRQGEEPSSLGFEEAGCALATAVALLPVRWHEAEVRWAEAVAAGLMGQLDQADPAGLPGLPTPAPLADDQRPSPVGVAIRSLHAFGHLTGRRHYLDASSLALRNAAHAFCAIPARHLTLLEALADQLGEPDLVVLPEPPAVRRGYPALSSKTTGSMP